MTAQIRAILVESPHIAAQSLDRKIDKFHTLQPARRGEDNAHTCRGYPSDGGCVGSKVHRDIRDAIGPIAVTYVTLAVCIV